MNEITRIHIAKVPYDIEVSAKKDIETYMSELEAYASDSELLQDIEIRMTELLAERGIDKNDVITSADVAAIREQLGEPKEFMSDAEDVVIGHETKTGGSRKLYRNIDSAVFGGVLSGIASFFRINALWVRLIFIVLLFITSGAILLVYAILWIAVPPARTAAEKLQMSGQPVTLSSIRELNASETEGVVEQRLRARAIRRGIAAVAGILSTLAAFGLLLVTAMAAVTVASYNIHERSSSSFSTAFHDMSYGGAGYYIAAYILAIICGLLLSALFALGAYAAFTHKVTKRLMITSIVVVVVGLMSFATIVGLVSYGHWQAQNQFQREITESPLSLPSNFGSIDNLTIDVGNANVHYIVDSHPRMTMTSLPGVKPTISLKGHQATISYDDQSGNTRFVPPSLEIYGPKLAHLTVRSGFVKYETVAQDLSVTVSNNASVTINKGMISNLSVQATDQSSVDASQGTVKTVTATLSTGAHVQLGTIAELIASLPTACPTSTRSEISINGLSAPTMTYNGQTLAAKTHQTSCGAVLIGEDDSNNYYGVY